MKIMLLAFAFFGCATKRDSGDIEGWTHQDASSFSFENIRGKDLEDTWYEVKNINGKIVPNPTDIKDVIGDSLRITIPNDSLNNTLTTKVVQRTADGWLVGFNNGEFGAELRWYSPNGDSSYMVSGHQLNQFFSIGKELYAIEGISHLTISRGSLIRLHRNEYWLAETVFEFPDEPLCAASNGKVGTYIFTSTRIFKLESGIKEVLEGGFWGYNQAINCILTDAGDLFLGTRSGVVKYSTGSKEIAWLSPKE